ncbi:4Fe-4S binding protein [Metallumcola ferriviriculae]|uniref:4Fe-4S binding protein n=1 Tax=Metallumcola ferriviriculae TaxID=3039180 RepID=A0AAU0UK22_9FIRM|nr:4Fe-4S binding protein [Desulfitibacteraceae bacterium MK1]
MKVLRVKGELCTQCYACEEVCSTNVSKERDRSKSAIGIGEKAVDTGRVDITTCDQCGQCIEVCPTNALYRAKSGVVLLNEDDCVGCLSCVGFCPSGAMFRHEDLLEPFKCTSCGKCVKECAEGALYLEDL